MLETDLLDQLKTALASSYRIVRELGGGGMSRVFLADDLALERAVVIKVLHPELAAGVNAERFKREVFLSARLQHPHIVPVLTAGDVDGLPYYVMPFVKGDSLRARIAQGPLPISDAIGIIGDVAKALSYAHSEGVVHRDIKPDNILLSGGAATVADFGIAKALSSARRDAGDGALTSLGTSLGTPAYMAPEQVAGDPDTDHRADIYSLGCVAYEMLTGKSPFAGKSPQQMLAAQVMEKPVPMETLRPGIPRALSALVMRCLEKEPSKRPQNAAEIAAPLETTESLPTFVSPSASRRGLWMGLAAVVLFAAIAVPLYRRTQKAPVSDGSLNLAVAPFEVLDPQLGLWKEGIVDVLSRNLDGAGPIKSMSPSVTIKSWDGHSDRASAVAFGRKIGAQLVVYGQLQTAGAGLVNAKLWVVDAERDVAPVEVEVRDSVARMDRVTDSLSVRSLAAISRLRTIGAAQLASLGSSSLPAIRAFLQGAQYFRRTQWDSATTMLRQAVTIDSSFGIAYAMLGETYGWIGEAGNDLRDQAFESASGLIRAGLSPHDSLTLTAIKHYAAANRRGPQRSRELRDAYAAAEAVTARYPDDASAWYLLADMKFHNDRDFTEREALAGFDRAIRADSDFAPAYIHAIELAYREGPELGRRYTDAYLKRRQSALQRNAVSFAMRMADGDLGGDKLRSVLDTVDQDIARNGLSYLRRLADTGEVAIDIVRAGVKRVPQRGQLNLKHQLAEMLAYRGHIPEAFKLALEEPHYTAAEIVALGLVPADSAAKLMGPWINRQDDASIAVLPVYGAARDTAMLKRFVVGAEKRAASDTNAQRKLMMGYFARSAHAYEMLAKGDSTEATKLFDALPDSIFLLPIDQYVRAKLVARSDPRRGLKLFERITSVSDLMYAARQLEIGRLAEKLGERARAVDAYAFVTNVWRNTDSAPLKDAVKEAGAALQRLDADGKLRSARLRS
ncbi:MAG: serine/threonine-protein kinase [Gemmatimonadaceae bacterium]